MRVAIAIWPAPARRYPLAPLAWALNEDLLCAPTPVDLVPILERLARLD